MSIFSRIRNLAVKNCDILFQYMKKKDIEDIATRLLRLSIMEKTSNNNNNKDIPFEDYIGIYDTLFILIGKYDEIVSIKDIMKLIQSIHLSYDIYEIWFLYFTKYLFYNRNLYNNKKIMESIIDYVLELLIYDGIYSNLYSNKIYLYIITNIYSVIFINYENNENDNILVKDSDLFNKILLSISIISTHYGNKILLELYKLLIQIIKCNCKNKILFNYTNTIIEKLLKCGDTDILNELYDSLLNNTYIYSFGIIKILIENKMIMDKQYIIDYFINNDNNVNNNFNYYIKELKEIYSKSKDESVQLLIVKIFYKYLSKLTDTKKITDNLVILSEFISIILKNEDEDVQLFSVRLYYYYITKFINIKNEQNGESVLKNDKSEILLNITKYYKYLKDKKKDNSSMLPFLIPIVKELIINDFVDNIEVVITLIKYCKYILNHLNIKVYNNELKMIGEILSYGYVILSNSDVEKPKNISISKFKIPIEEISISKYLGFYKTHVKEVNELLILLLFDLISNNQTENIFVSYIIYCLLELQEDNGNVIFNSDNNNYIENNNTIINKDNINDLYQLIMNIALIELKSNNMVLNLAILLKLSKKEIKYDINSDIQLLFLNKLYNLLKENEQSFDNYNLLNTFFTDFSLIITKIFNDNHKKYYYKIFFNYYSNKLKILNEEEKLKLIEFLSDNISIEYMLFNIVELYANNTINIDFISKYLKKIKDSNKSNLLMSIIVMLVDKITKSNDNEIRLYELIYLLFNNIDNNNNNNIPFTLINNYLTGLYNSINIENINEILKLHFDYMKGLKNKDLKNYIINEMSYLTINYIRLTAVTDKYLDNIIGIKSSLTILLSIYNMSHKSNDILPLLMTISIQCCKLSNDDISKNVAQMLMKFIKNNKDEFKKILGSINEDDKKLIELTIRNNK